MINMLNTNVTITLETQEEINLFRALIGSVTGEVARAFKVKFQDVWDIYREMEVYAVPGCKFIRAELIEDYDGI